MSDFPTLAKNECRVRRVDTYTKNDQKYFLKTTQWILETYYYIIECETLDAANIMAENFVRIINKTEMHKRE